MLCEVPLTKEQQTFATAHHSLVYKFLNENRLPEDEFYDVVIFGYLKAVRDYFSDLTAQQFTFSTIANRRMKFCLFDYFRTQERRKEKALLPLLSSEASIAFEQYQAAVQCRNSAVLEQAYASGYRTAVQMFAAGLGPQPPIPEHGEDSNG